MRMCECVSICPCMRDVCIQCTQLCGHTHVEARDCPYMHSPITLHFKCWVLVSHWMTDLVSLVSPLAMGIPYLHCPNAAYPSSMWVLEVRLVSLSLKSAPPRTFVCCLLGYQVERCSSYTMQCKGTFTVQLMLTQGGLLETVWRNGYRESLLGRSSDLTQRTKLSNMAPTK